MKKKICKLSTIVCVSLFLLGLTITAHASDTSQTLVADGRALLFNGGDPTYSGILSANAKFDAAVTEDSSDQEANLFYAVTRIMAFGLEQGSNPELETLRELFEAFGISRNNVDLVETDVPFNDPPEIYDHYDPPETIPGGEDVRAFLAGPFVTLLGNAIDNLNAIPYTTSNITTLLASEIDDDQDIEVDYGDVIVLKSALYMLKSSILIATAYDLNINLRELLVLGNAGVLQIQRDLLNETKYPKLLHLHTTDGAASLTNAKLAFLDGIDAYQAALTFITTTESDTQENDLFYFESAEEQREAEFILTQLSELKNSLNDNRIAEFIIVEDTWILTDGNGKRLQIEIEKDVNGNFLGGHAWGMDGCDFLFCGGWVEDYTVSGTTITFNMACSGWCPGLATLTGTLSGNQIVNGTYNATNCERNWNGTFTGLLESSETEIEKIDFNLIFGNTNKSPLDIKDILPEFDQYNEPVPDTFPGVPVLNGILPELTTNDDLTREMDLQPSGFFNIPTVTEGDIVIDGNQSDWTSESLAFTDLVDDENENANFVGTDIHKFYLTKDSTYLYIGMELYDGDPKADNASGYVFQANQSHDKHSTPGDRIASVWYHNGDWISNVGERTWQEQQPIQINSYSSNYAAAGNKFIEWKVLLDDMGNLSGRFINAYSHFMGSYDYISYPLSDSNLTAITLDTASISGTIICSAHDPSITSKIFIYARDALTGRDLGETYITSPGTYTITGLPAGVSVNLFARWDADDNGIKTFLDYLGETGPITVTDGETTVPEFSINTLIDDSYIMTKPGLYRVFGSNAYTIPQDYYGHWDPNDVDWGSGWTFIGESNKTETFNTGQYYKNILIIWDEEPVFNFDAFEDLTAGTAFATNADGTSCEYNWISSGLKNFDTYDWIEPYYFKGHPDGLSARTQDWYGFSLFTMPGDTFDLSTSRQLKITLVSNLVGDLDGDNNVGIADAIHALRVVSNCSDVIIDLNFNSDINGNGRIGLEEAIYALQHSAELRTCETRDIEDYMYIEGHVYAAGTSNSPVQGAVVSTSLDSQTATTDANGHFFLQTNTLAEYSSTPYTITISASGYQTYSVEHTWGDHPVDQVFIINQ